MDIRAGQIVLSDLFDVANTIDLQVISRLIGGATAAKLLPKQATPPYIRHDKPPLSFDGEVVGLHEVDGFTARIRLYDYGVVSIALTRPFSGSWGDLVGLARPSSRATSWSGAPRRCARRSSSAPGRH